MHNATPEQIESFLNSGGETRVVIRKIERIAIDPAKQNALLDLQRNHWRKLHTQSFDETTFETWVATIPGCPTCQRDFRKLLESSPPRFDDWFRWTWEIHNLVNAKLNKPNLTFEDACELWQSNPLPPDKPSALPDQ